ASALPTSRQARTVSAPRRARTAAASNPIPEFAPVTTAVRPRWPGTSATVHGPCLTLIARVLPRSRPVPTEVGSRGCRAVSRRKTGGGLGCASAPRSPGAGGYAQTHAYPQPARQRFPSRPGVRALLRADVRDRDHARDPHHPAPLAAHG